ncbi:hypothetical protein BJV82DRAFT_590076 [Fennellomyces sp. T-0311]|nr:hypothetical protein BJV82DRAFT_590076 [Fennellomyces sp. T-0311]
MASKPANNSAVSNVVNDLIRAAVGGNTQDIADDDLDKYVADLILKEAETKRKKYNNVGVRAYQPDTGIQPNSLPKPNKRFFLNMIKATDSYNQSLKEQEEQLARQKERDRRHGDHRRRDDSSADEYRKRRRRRDERDSHHKRHRRHDTYEGYSHESEEEHRSRRHDSDRPSYSEDDDEKTDKHIPLPVTVRGRGRVTQGSKMDKYFSKSYNPDLDIEPDLDQLVYTEFDVEPKKTKKKKEKKEKKKSKKKKKSSKRKRDESTDSDDSGGDDVRVELPPPPKAVRAWDVGK